MIESFKCKETKNIFYSRQSKKFNAILKIVCRKLDMLDAAHVLEDLKIPPGNRLEALKGDRDGQYSIRINDQFRICFEWHENNAFNVEIVDYH